MPELREYQKKFIEEISEKLEPGRPLMASMGTGGGKTAIAASLAKSGSGLLFVTNRTLFLAPSISIVNQAPEEFSKWGISAIDGRAENWNRAIRSNSPLIASTYATAWSRLKNAGSTEYLKFNTLIIDEAHHAYDHPNSRITRLVKDFAQRGVKVVGLTATPWRLSKKVGFNETWTGGLIKGPSWPQMSRDGFLVPARIKQSHYSIEGGSIQNGEFSISGIYERNNIPVLTRRAITWLMDECGTGESMMRTIIYAVSQGHAVNIANEALDAGMPVGLLLSGDEYLAQASANVITDRNEAVAAFKYGTCRVLVNVGVLTEGFDVPASECVMVLRPTMSLALWLQMCGRGSRITPGKDEVLILDAGQNTPRHDYPDTHRDWSLLPRGQANPDDTEILRRCTGEGNQGCNTKIPTGSHACPLCGQQQGVVCKRCGKYRFWDRWPKRDPHEEGVVCELCEEEERVYTGSVEYDSFFVYADNDRFGGKTWVSPNWSGQLEHGEPYLKITPTKKGDRFRWRVLIRNNEKYRGYDHAFNGYCNTLAEAQEYGLAGLETRRHILGFQSISTTPTQWPGHWQPLHIFDPIQNYQNFSFVEWNQRISRWIKHCENKHEYQDSDLKLKPAYLPHTYKGSITIPSETLYILEYLWWAREKCEVQRITGGVYGADNTYRPEYQERVEKELYEMGKSNLIELVQDKIGNTIYETWRSK